MCTSFCIEIVMHLTWQFRVFELLFQFSMLYSLFCRISMHPQSCGFHVLLYAPCHIQPFSRIFPIPPSNPRGPSPMSSFHFSSALTSSPSSSRASNYSYVTDVYFYRRLTQDLCLEEFAFKRRKLLSPNNDSLKSLKAAK